MFFHINSVVALAINKIKIYSKKEIQILIIYVYYGTNKVYCGVMVTSAHAYISKLATVVEGD